MMLSRLLILDSQSGMTCSFYFLEEMGSFMIKKKKGVGVKFQGGLNEPFFF